MDNLLEDKVYNSILKRSAKVRQFCNSTELDINLSVHEIRRSFKRIRARLNLFKESFLKEKLKKEVVLIRDLGRTISPVRESFVNLECFNKLFQAEAQKSNQWFKKCQRRLKENNEAMVQSIIIEQSILSEIHTEIISFEKRLPAYFKKPVGNLSLLKSIQLSYGKCYDACRGITEEKSSSVLHELRIKLKNLLYQLEAIKFTNPYFFGEIAKALNAVTELFGDEHDLDVLNNFIHQHCHKVSPVISEKIQYEQERLKNHIFPELTKSFSLHPKDFENKLIQLTTSYLEDH